MPSLRDETLSGAELFQAAYSMTASNPFILRLCEQSLKGPNA